MHCAELSEPAHRMVRIAVGSYHVSLAGRHLHVDRSDGGWAITEDAEEIAHMPSLVHARRFLARQLAPFRRPVDEAPRYRAPAPAPVRQVVLI